MSIKAFIVKNLLRIAPGTNAGTAAGELRVDSAASNKLKFHNGSSEAQLIRSDQLADLVYDNSSSGLSSTNPKAALDEVEARVDTAETDIGTLQTDVGTLQTDVGTLQSGRATTALDNLSSTAINASLVSDTDEGYNLGSASKHWSIAYIQALWCSLAGAALDIAAEKGISIDPNQFGGSGNQTVHAGHLSLTNSSDTGNVGELRLVDDSNTAANYRGFKAPASVTTPGSWAVPAADGTNGQIIKTDGSGNLSFTDTAINVSGTVTETHGGTNQTTYAKGDTLYASATDTISKLSGNTTTTKKFLVQTGDGTSSAAPVWNTIVAGDVPTLNQNTTGTASNVTGTVAIANGGTGQTSQTAAFDALAPTTTKGDIIASNGSDNVRVAVGSDGTFLKADSGAASGVSWASPAGANLAVRSVTTTDSPTTADDILTLSGASFTVTLPTAVGNTGKILRLHHNGTSLSQKYTLNTTGGQTIGGIASGSYILTTKGEVLVIYSDGTNWQILEHKTATGENTWTPTFNGVSASSSVSGVWWREGKFFCMRAFASFDTVTTGTFRCTFPTGVALDTTNLGSGYTFATGEIYLAGATATAYPASTRGPWKAVYESGQTGSFGIATNVDSNVSGATMFIAPEATNAVFASGNTAAFYDMKFPISDWQP